MKPFVQSIFEIILKLFYPQPRRQKHRNKHTKTCKPTSAPFEKL
jgi:hypothetical protein